MATRLSRFNPKPSFSNYTCSTIGGRARPPKHISRVVAVAKNQSYWTSIEADIEAYLKKAIPIRPPETVFEPMHYLTFAAPRTTASSLCVAACELVGGDRSQAMAAASAIHLMHAAAYTHEHLPLTDRPRPKPTIEHKFGPNIELLTGDGIIPFGLEMLARSMDLAQTNHPDRTLRVMIEITRASGSQGVVDGQYHELGLDQLGASGWESVEYVCRKKEGELHACGTACGAILGGGDEEEIEKLKRFGLYVGISQGMLGKKKSGFKEKIQALQKLAIEELESFQWNKTELITSLVEYGPFAPARV